MIGILALQGAFREHKEVLENLGQRTVLVKKPSQLQAIEGLIFCGGESTTISLLIDKYDFKKPLEDFISTKSVFATCAGLVLLAKEVIGGNICLPYLDVTVRRNAFGRQVDSFEDELKIKGLEDKPYPAVFIRAPIIEKVGKNVEVLAKYDEKIVAVRQDNILACAFHPELTKDYRLHELFVKMIKRGERLEVRGE